MTHTLTPTEGSNDTYAISCSLLWRSFSWFCCRKHPTWKVIMLSSSIIICYILQLFFFHGRKWFVRVSYPIIHISIVQIIMHRRKLYPWYQECTLFAESVNNHHDRVVVLVRGECVTKSILPSVRRTPLSFKVCLFSLYDILHMKVQCYPWQLSTSSSKYQYLQLDSLVTGPFCQVSCMRKRGVSDTTTTVGNKSDSSFTRTLFIFHYLRPSPQVT